MNLQIHNKETFVRYFLSPVSKLNENVVVKVKPDKITTITSSPDSSVFLNCTYSNCNATGADEEVLNIPDVTKLSNAINCINAKDLQFEYDDKTLKYISSDINFKVHLLEDGIINTPAVNINKLKNIEFDCSFEINYDNLQTLIKGSTFATDTNKLYFELKDGKVTGVLRDSDNEYINTFSSIISDTCEGCIIENPVPITFEVIRMILGVRFSTCRVHLSTKLNVFLFDISTDEYNINYIVSGLRR